MQIVYTAEHAGHNPSHEFFDGALIETHETPVRAELILAALQQAGFGPVVPPQAHGLAPILAVHQADYLDFLEHAYTGWVQAGGNPQAVIPCSLTPRQIARYNPHPLAAPGYFAFDTCAPIVAGTYTAARAAADSALSGVDLLLQGAAAAYVLCRPPGHHAGSDHYGGYCFLNNVAIAAHYLLEQVDGLSRSAPARVAVLDIDFHHGNGTQQIFYQRNDVLVVSLHADPLRHYPYFCGYADERGSGAGEGLNLNIPLPAGIDNAGYLAALQPALQAISDFAPAALLVSAGFDTYGGDPICDFALTTPVYAEIGARLAQLKLPTLLVQEGGYAQAALGENVVSLLRGFSGSQA